MEPLDLDAPAGDDEREREADEDREFASAEPPQHELTLPATRT